MTWTDLINDKITDLERLAERVRKWKALGDKIVFTNGCFDILHLGHVDYLSKAAEYGDRFIIGLNSDLSVQRLKGKERPFNPEKSRSMLLASMAFVDAVCIFSDDTPQRLIEELSPDVLVKGGDYTESQVIGAEFVKSKGGQVILVPFLDGYSSSIIIDQIRNSK